MKKVIFVNSVWLRVALTLLVLLCLQPCVNVKAQTIQSAQYQFPSRLGWDAVVRESAGGVPVISYRSAGGAYFAYGDPSTGYVLELSINDTLMVGNNSISYKINDMRVIGDMCYFCGVRMYTHGELDPETGAQIVDSIGILGRFYLNPSGSGLTGKFDLKHFPETKRIDRMTIYGRNIPGFGNDTVVAMIGIMQNFGSPSCLIVAKLKVTPVWEYIVRYADNYSGMDEIFTDITSNMNKIVIASYIRGVGEENYFYLRTAERDSVRINNFGQFDTRYKYDLLQLSDSCFSLVRPDNAIVRLCTVPWAKKLYASFACNMNSTHSLYPTALCEITTDNMDMIGVQVVRKTYITPYTLIDMKYLYKVYNDENDATVALLHNTNEIYKTVVEYPQALTSNCSTYYKMLVQQLVDSKMLSLSAYNGNDIRFGGVYGETPTKLTYLQELQPLLFSKSLCMENNDADVFATQKNVIPEPENRPLVCKQQEMNSLVWGKKSAGVTAINAVNTCSY